MSRTGQTSDVRARATDVFALDDRYTLPLRGKSPGGHRPSHAAAQNYEIVFFDACFSAHVHFSNVPDFLKVLRMVHRVSECI
jgi:hypothetical protein